MMKRIFNLIILDESGSMSSIEKEAVDGVNETLQTIRKAVAKDAGQEQYVTFVTFNEEMKTVYELKEGSNVRDITQDDYSPNGCTALFDAMGRSIQKLKAKVSEDDIVLVTIITDGYENASKEFDIKSINALVNKYKTKGWLFTYIGANQDVEKVAMSISINNYMPFYSTKEGTKEALRFDSECRSRLYARLSEDAPCDDLFEGNFFKKDE